MLKFVVLSDLHVVGPGETSHGLDTAERVRAGVRAVNARYPDAAFCVLAGDLTDYGKADSYEVLKEALGDLTIPCHITLGNHDHRPTFLEVFGQDHAAETGCVDKVIDAQGTRVILLDSSEPGLVAGRLQTGQLSWLEARLAEAADRPVIVILHHHANPLRTNVDRIILEDGEAFVRVLKTHPDIRQVIAGHVHYPSTAMWHGIPFTTIAGSHYSVTINIDKPDETVDRLHGPGQYAVVLSTAEDTLVHFENYIDGNAVLEQPAPA